MSDILFLAHRVPFPPDRGDKIRSFNIVRHLAARARVHVIAFADDPADGDPPPAFRALTASLTVVPRTKSRARAAVEALATGRPVSLAAFASPAMAAAVAQVHARHNPAATCIFSGQMAQYGVDADTVMDFVDMDSAKFAQFAQGASPPVAWLMRREARLLGAFERDVARRARASLFVSEAEAALFRASGGVGDVLENGIDTAAFDPVSVRAEPVAGPLIVFTGQMDYRPNIDAVTWFATEVLPQIPAARFAIVGRAPTAAVRALAGERVIVTGAVADVRGWLAAASVCVAPLLIARGVQNKVLEAMAMARPVVATPAAAEGIDHRDTLHIAGDASAFADTVRALIADRDAAEALGARARAQVIARYGWDACLAPLDGMLGL